MIRFYYKNNKHIFVDAIEDEDLMLCPECTLPNHSDAISCVGCKHQFIGEDNIWACASEIIQCQDCQSYCTTDYAKCPVCDKTLLETHTEEFDNNSLHHYCIICPNCGTKNEQDADNCTNCNKSLENVDPVDDDLQHYESAECCQSIQISVENFKTRERKTLTVNPETYIIVGREEELGEQLQDCARVSRLHCLIGILGQNIYIVDLSSCGTFIDGIRAVKGYKTPLRTGAQVILGAPTVSESKAAVFVFNY